MDDSEDSITHIPYIPTFCVMSRTTGMPTLRTTTPSPSFRGTASTRVQRESEPQRGVEITDDFVVALFFDGIHNASLFWKSGGRPNARPTPP
ncbi:hypothetical protein J6590_101198 [Homalodisca vitripennis]|nr:hypothetical protein J6590_101198 [Homalodisca vitripennis]